MQKTVPISVRITQEDAEFIARLKIDDAITPSDKIRALIRDARLQHGRQRGYEGQLAQALDELRGVMQQVKTQERESHTHSELVNVFLDWLAEAFAYTAAVDINTAKEKTALPQLEEGIADRCFRLLEALARMGVTSRAPCYDKDIISKGFQPLAELTRLVNQRIESIKE